MHQADSERVAVQLDGSEITRKTISNTATPSHAGLQQRLSPVAAVTAVAAVACSHGADSDSDRHSTSVQAVTFRDRSGLGDCCASLGYVAWKSIL